jgi:PKD domain
LIVSPPGTLAATVSVLLAPVPSDPPTATLAVDPNPVLTGTPVKLDASASSDPLDRAIVDYHWDVGSGMLDRDTGQNATISATYATVGVVNLRVLVTNTGGTPAIAAAKLTVLAPTAARIRALLAEQLSPPPQAARLSSLLRHRGYSFEFPAPTAGRLQIRWYLHSHARRKRVLIAAGSRMCAAAGIIKVSVRLTSDGKRVLRQLGSVLVTGKATFTPTGKRPVFAMRTFKLLR